MVTAVLGQYQDQVGFDCASLSEIRLALEYTDNNARRCIYANPQRAEKDLDTALSLGVEALTFDGSQELLKVHRAHEKRPDAALPPEMILRILVPDDSSSVPLGEKFGVLTRTNRITGQRGCCVEITNCGSIFSLWIRMS